MNYVRFKPQRGLFHLEALIYECVGAAHIIEFMKERLSSTNETTEQEDTGGSACTAAPPRQPATLCASDRQTVM